MSSTPSLEIPDLSHALLWREATVRSNRAAAQDHELAREGLVEDLRDEAVWRSFATHYRDQRTLETDTAMLEALSDVDLLNRYRSASVESIDAVLHRAEQLKPIQLPNEVNPVAQQQVVSQTTDQYQVPEEQSFRDVTDQLSNNSTIPSTAPVFQPPSKSLVFEAERSQPGAIENGPQESIREEQRFSLSAFVKNLFGGKQSEPEESRLDELQGAQVASDPDRGAGLHDSELMNSQTEEEDEERDALYYYLIDGVDGYLSYYRYTEDEPSNRELRAANRYADAVVSGLQQKNPGASYGELLNKVQAQDRAEFHPSWDKPVMGPAEENAKAELLDLLADEHISPWSLEYGTETFNELFERAEEEAGDDLDWMVKANPNASYVELLAQKTAEEKHSAGQLRDFENSELKTDYNPVAGTIDTLDKQNNTRIHIIVPEIGIELTQEQIETRLEEAREQIEGEQEEVLEQKEDQRSEQKALEGDQNKESRTKSDELRLSEIEAELIGTQSLGKDYGKYSNHRADSQSGVYNGPITAETDHHLVQQISARSNVIHEKQRLFPVPELGESVAVSYNRGVANVLQQQDPARDLSRVVGMAR